MKRNWIWIAVWAVLCLGCFGGGGSSDESGSETTEGGSDSGAEEGTLPPSTFADVKAIFALSCNFQTCHGNTPKKTNGKLSLLDEVSYDSLVGLEPDNENASADGMLLVEPGVPENSFLLFKMELPWGDGDGEDPLYGFPMPQVFNGTLPPEQLEVIRSWIADGAPNN